MRVLRKKDCTIHLRCDIITMGGWAFSLGLERRDVGVARIGAGAREYFLQLFQSLPKLERINNKILGLWKL